MSSLLLFAEHQNGRLLETTLEVAAAARECATKLRCELVALLAGSDARDHLASLGDRGVDRVLLCEDATCDGYAPEVTVQWIADRVDQHDPVAVLFAETPYGADLAVRLAARRNTGLASRCTALSPAPDGALQATCTAYGDRLQTTITGAGTVTLQRGVWEVKRAPRTPVIEEVPLAPEAGARLTLLETRKADPRTVPLPRAEFILSGGNGVRDFGSLWELADRLGAAVGGSRVVCDDGRLVRERQVGESGVTVKPRCYLALGISGASQHLRGMQDSETIICVNTDRHAPLMKRAHLAVVADAEAVIGAMLARLETNLATEITENTETGKTVNGIEDRGPVFSVPSVSSVAKSPTPSADGTLTRDVSVRHVVVCVTDVFHPHDLRPPENGAPRPVGCRMPNRADECAVAMAGRLAAPSVTLLSVAPPDAEEVLDAYLGLGADRLLRIWDPALADADAAEVALLLARAADRLNPDLILCGDRAHGGFGSGLTGPSIAARLGRPFAGSVVEIQSPRAQNLTVHRLLQRGDRQVIETPLPAVLAVSAEADPPGYPALSRIRRARREALDLAALHLDIEAVRAARAPVQVGPWSAARPRPRKLFAPPTTVSAAERMRMVMGGGRPKQTTQETTFEGTPEDAAERILQLLRQEKLL